MTTGKIVAGTLAVLLVTGYATLDALDVVPGPLTTAPQVAAQAPFPTISATFAPPEDDFTGEPIPAGDVTEALARFVSAPEVGPRVAVDIRDAATGDRIAGHNPTQVGPPASSIKVLTAAAALSELGAATTLQTTAVLADSTLILVGGGDLLLGTGEAAVGADGRASLTDLAAQAAAALKASGVSTVSVGVDDTLFVGPGAEVWTEREYRWVIRMTPLAMHGGMAGNEFVSAPDYTIVTGEAFAAELAAQGIAVSGPPVRMQAPAGAALVGSVSSATIEEVTAWMLTTSNNSVAEALARLVAIAAGEGSTAADGARAVTESVKELGLPTTGTVLHDTSGLAPENMVSPELLAMTIQLARSGAEPRLTGLMAGLPVSFLDGTLADRLQSVAGMVRAKTGTLSEVVSLTGTVQADSGAVLVFSIVAGGLEPGGMWEARRVIDEFVAELGRIA